MDIEKNPYSDIIHLPHHKAPNRPHMSMYDRAAQFSPFAALTGFDGVIAETGRLTDRKIELSESEKILLDQKLTLIDDVIQDKHHPEITVDLLNFMKLIVNGIDVDIVEIISLRPCAFHSFKAGVASAPSPVIR